MAEASADPSTSPRLFRRYAVLKERRALEKAARRAASEAGTFAAASIAEADAASAVAFEGNRRRAYEACHTYIGALLTSKRRHDVDEDRRINFADVSR